MKAPEKQADPIKEAIQRFASSLGIHPRDKRAIEERRLANLYLNGRLAYSQKEWDEAITNVRDVYNARSEYAGGWAARTLYSAYVQQGDEYLAADNCQLALDMYRLAQTIDVADQSVAEQRVTEAQYCISPPTATATLTSTPSPTPLATDTPRFTPTPVATTPAPTSTPVPATPVATATDAAASYMSLSLQNRRRHLRLRRLRANRMSQRASEEMKRHTSNAMIYVDHGALIEAQRPELVLLMRRYGVRSLTIWALLCFAVPLLLLPICRARGEGATWVSAGLDDHELISLTVEGYCR